jgi:hypothetical protein
MDFFYLKKCAEPLTGIYSFTVNAWTAKLGKSLQGFPRKSTAFMHQRKITFLDTEEIFHELSSSSYCLA